MSSYPCWMRRIARLVLPAFVSTAVLQVPMQALAQHAATERASVPDQVRKLPSVPVPSPRPVLPPASLKHNAHPLTPEQALRLEHTAKVSSITLLDEVGRLTHPVPAASVSKWRKELGTPHLSPSRAAHLHVWVGEWELAQNEEPERALTHFEHAQTLAKPSDSAFGLAAYDTAVALFYEGAYERAAGAFHNLLARKQRLSGFDRRNTSRFLAHAKACAGYHDERRRMGIPEPPKLDPLCAASGLAISLRAMGSRFDKQSILPFIRHTGEGSNMMDILDAAKRLGVAAHAVSTDDKGLIALPKPLIAYVEHDHFITIMKADKAGVTYMCSDCGAWPGGTVRLTWKQWHKLEASAYVAVVPKGSEADAALAHIVARGAEPWTGMRLASVGKLSNLNLQGLSLAARLANHVFAFTPTTGNGCGNKYGAQPCSNNIQCPTDCDECNQNSYSPRSGDPVNLATGEEEYTPPTDLTVYNPVGPAVSWGRLYNSLRPPSSDYNSNDFGIGWSHTYNIGLMISGGSVTPMNPNSTNSTQSSAIANGVAPQPVPIVSGSLIFPNGSKYTFSASTSPSSTQPVVPCTINSGSVTAPVLMEWDYDASNGSTYYTITFQDRTKWVMKSSTASSTNWCPLSKIIDCNGNAITFSYTAPTSGFPLLTGIADKNGQALVTFTRASDGSLTAISDRYGRSIYYRVSSYATSNVPASYPQAYKELDKVSQIVPTGTATPPDRYAYGYYNLVNRFNEGFPFLHTITTPSPTGTGTATATINYDPITEYVTSRVDANGNRREYTAVDANHTKVTIKDSAGNLVYSHTVGFNSDMSETTNTDGSNTTSLSSRTYADANNPYRPSSVTDANGKTANYTWDKYGNTLTSTSPRGTVTTYTYSYANFALGELTNVQEGSKTPTTFNYYEPSGLIQAMTLPKPGTMGGGTVSYSYTYDGLGNILTTTGPGNTNTQSKTITFNYTSDGTYSQAAATSQPLVKTDNLGHAAHYRYDSRGNRTAIIDALGNETDMAYNLANQGTTVTFAATGQSGTGRASVVNTYQYPGGPQSYMTQYNENGTAVYQHMMTYGLEGEGLTRTGSTQSVTQTYDAEYRLKTSTDGNNHSTTYSYNAAGYPSQITYPNGDTIAITNYDANGNPTRRVDGRGIVTTFAYTDPESKLTDIQYAATPALNVHLTYDSYGRKTGMTDGAGSQSWTYDDSNNLTTATTTYTGLPAQIINYAYNPDRSRQSLNAPNLFTSGKTFTYNYDGAGRMTGLTNPAGNSWTWGYANNDWLTSQNAAGTVVTTPTRDARGFITDLSNNRTDIAHTLLSDYTVTYGPNLTISSVSANLPAAPAPFSGTTNYIHDTKVQLTMEQSTRGGGYSNGFAYDGAGNPTTFKGAASTFNAANQNTAFAYDGNGNPTTYKGATCTYDAENRLTAYGSVLTAGYRGDGLRAWKQNSAGQRTYFIYDGDTLLYEMDSNGQSQTLNTWGQNVLLARTYTPGAFYTVSPMPSTPVTLLFTYDLHGNVAQQVNALTGDLVASYIFDAYGTSTASVSSGYTTTRAASDPYSGLGGSEGYYKDTETGLQLLTHRYYDPANGRFLTRDLMGVAGGVNLYAYCSNSSVGGSDPSGLTSLVGILKGLWNELGWEGVLTSCGASAAIALGQIAGSALVTHDGNALNAACKSLGSCIGSLAGTVVGLLPALHALPPVVVGCVTGAISGAISDGIGALCDYLVCHAKTNLLCSLMGVMTSSISGCVGGAIYGGGGEGTNEKPSFKGPELGIINTIGNALGFDVESACNLKLGPFKSF